ncbi:nuclear transport factor 2 family protein [Streptomyces litchfieldiae]|uniref:Nuclear transport factor 2 family protein n=1 Tax=Streptomyces litchfieldiae TaxID=3075543 RepID=A0ABU2MJS3_9ACTN|nr:nuclear transport factor 2 family protein [Streptomyces sp. DSM 44938]MDT0341354.1 nuclear transport factor 2 family protein [Streptomyces sp. DSM 44938]
MTDGEEIDPLERLLAERACERLITEFLRHLDLGNPGAVAELFTPDGVWEYPQDDRLVRGRDALREYFRSRPADRLSLRMATNILVTVESPDTASATSYFATYRVDGFTGGIVPSRPPANVGHYADTFTRVDGRWLLARRVTHVTFGGPTVRLDETSPAD